MAEFKLGRIRFVWKNEWTASTVYYVDDVVKNGGQLYICTVGHTANSDFYVDLAAATPRWNLLSSGQSWEDMWSTSTYYKTNDIVKYGGNLYICNTAHTSAATASLGLEDDLANWNVYAEGFEWKTDWTVETRYKINDLVKYGGYTYVCNTGHTSAATVELGLEDDAAYWDTFNAGVEYKSNWTTGTRYKLNDVVKEGAGLWIATSDHTASVDFDTDGANWEQFVEGISYESAWSSITQYQPGDVVSYGGNQYVAKTVHTNETPSTSTANWDLFSSGFDFQGDWSDATSYKIGQVVRYNGYTYISTADATRSTTTVSATDAGSQLFTVTSTSGFVVGMAVRFTGTTFGNVFTNATYYIKTISVGGTTFTVSTTPDGTTFTPTTATGTMTATVLPLPTNSSYYSRLSSGIRWQGVWTDDTEYVLGDAVRYGSNAYICVLGHRSEADDGSTIGATGGGAANSRPDQDTSGTYWNALTIGSEVSTLTTTGDLVYYGGAGPTRLPVGTQGQVLTVGLNNTPEWQYLWAADHEYYVSTVGTDGPYPVYGSTLQSAWKTIRYACEQVLNGPRNPNAKFLLEMNRAFIQREVTEWIDYQIANNIAPFTSSFDYDEYKCERDTGLVVDAVVYDISHGGNVRSRGAALAYVNALEDSPGTYVTLSTEKEEDIAAFNYMLEVVENVLDQVAPTTNYQTLNGDNSTSVVAQYFNSDLQAESGVMPVITSLVTIITNALNDEDADNIPARVSPNNLIKVATGVYREVLPIIVPENTCILGSELRSTNAGPQVGTTSIDDAKYSIGAIGRLGTIVGDLVKGATVTPTTGNTESQSQEVPFADTTQEADVERLARVIQQNIDFRLGTTVLVANTDPIGYNSGFLGGYGDARKLIKENKEFIKAEIIAYIAENYPNVKYSKTICKRDVGYIIDAMLYDLTYGGSTQSLNAGLAYFDGTTGLMIDSSELTATLASYSRLKTVMQQIITNTLISKSETNTATQWTDSTNLTGGSTASAFIGANIDIITNILAGDSTTNTPPSVTVTSITGTDTFVTAGHNLQAGDLVVPVETQNGLTVGTRYYVIASGLTGTDFKVSTTYAGSAATGFSNGSGLTLVMTYEDRPIATDGVTSTTALITAFTSLSAATGTIVSNMTAFIAANYPSLTYNSAKCERDAKIILDAVGYDFMFNSNQQTVKAAYAYLRSSASDVFDLGQKAATRAAFSYVKTQALANVGGDATAQSRIETLMIILDDIIYSATNEGSPCATEVRNADHAVLQLERNRAFIVAEIDAWIQDTYSDTVTNTTVTSNVITVSDTSWLQRNAGIRFTGTVFGGVTTGVTYYVQNVVNSTTFTIATTRNATTSLTLSTATGTMGVELYYNSALCLRDVNEYLNALKYDIKYPGNYRALLSSRYYANAVIGSLEEDMYYLRDGTGIRDQTLEGLTGDLLAPNEYGTSRVSGGAYCSLDPGYGPDDFHTWIINRSPYVQGVTTIGYGAVGQKIDGALHNGGNDSIVSNDFTQVISDGIGAWITNNGRAELVSVFTYYAHIGYLAENGGRIRATNGNNSYGDFGAIAEGFDSSEIPNTAIVDNKFQFSATVGSVFTDGTDNALVFEFDNAGTDYTEVTWNVTGSGLGAITEGNEFRDDAVFQVRLLDNVDDSTTGPEADGNEGGFGYLTNTNTAQTGSSSGITLAVTDDRQSTDYIGMKVLITAGTGVGQYALIATYSAGTKAATVIKESTGGAGWDHVIPGTTIVSPDATSIYLIEPAVEFTAPGYASSARTLPSAEWVGVAYSEVFNTYINVSATGGAGSGATFDVTRKGIKYTATLKTAGINYDRLNTLTIAGTSLGGSSTTNDITITVTSINSTTGAIQAFDVSGIGAGGNYIALATGTRTVATSNNGTSWAERTLALPTSTTWTAIASGKLSIEETAGSFVVGRSYTITDSGDTSWTGIGASSVLVGTSFVATGAGSGTGTAVPNEVHAVAVASGGTANAYSKDGGITWTAGGALPSSGTWSSIAYGEGIFVAVRSGSTASAYSLDGGASWTAGGALPASTTWSSVAYGAGVWVAIATGGVQAAYSTDSGVTWTTSALTSTSQDWTSVTYGNGRFVAVANTAGTVAAYSLDGITWTASTIPSATYTSVTYGQGVFLAVSQNTQAATSEDGVVWTSRTTSTAANGFSGAAFGNPDQYGLFVAVQRSTAGTVASSFRTGARTKARAFVAGEKIFAIRITEPGSGYTTAPSITITDPNNIFEAPTLVRIGKGALANPSFIDRGTGFESAGAEIDSGNGYGDYFQTGRFVAVRRLTERPAVGSNVVFGHLPDETFKLVSVITFLGSFDGSYTCFLQISPEMKSINTPEHGTTVSTRIRYSQARMTGHDFLDIGTGNLVETNYPGLPSNTPNPANETQEGNGGRVFYTSTDQDGNFRVGGLFNVEQSTGIATLNADAFNIAGLQELSLGEVTLGGGSATITEFSTDPFFTANSDSVIPTQRAIKAYISSQIGGGGASLNVNSVTAGVVFIATNSISTIGNETININATMNFTKGVTGLPLAFNYFIL
jgi:hypothetical protein